MHITVRHLEVFHAVMEAGSVSRAAEVLNLTQPAVSIALSKLEDELGYALFHRSKGYFAPTARAQMLHVEAEQGLLAIERVRTRAREIGEGGYGSLSVASNGATAINLLPWLIAEFQKDHPGFRIDVQIRSSRKIASWVAGRQSDIGLLDAPVPIPGLPAEIFRMPCVCIMQAGDPLADCETVTPEMLAGRAVVAVTGDHDIDRRLDRICAERGIPIERPVSASYFAIVRNLVSAGAGIGIVDKLNGTVAREDGVIWRRFEPDIFFELALVVGSESTLSAPGRAFLALLRERLAGFEA